MEKKLNVFLIFLLSVFILSAGISLSGCGGTAGTSRQSSAASSGGVTLTGTVKGGFKSITATSVAVYGCTAMDISNCTEIASVIPDSSSFSITFNPDSVDTSYFVKATAGDVELEAVVPPNIPSGGITVNEYTTMLTQEAYYYTQKTNAVNAALTTLNILSLEDPSYDGMPNTISSSNTSLQAIAPYLVVMADDLAACIDASSSPYSSLASTSACTTLESDVNTGIGTATSAPTTVHGILSNIADTITTYYANQTNSADKAALLTMQDALNTIIPNSPDFTYSFSNLTGFSPSTMPQPSIGGSSISFSITMIKPPSSSPDGLVLMHDAGCLSCHTITTSINSVPYTFGPGAPFNNPSSPYYAAPDLSYVANYLNFYGIGMAVDTMIDLPTAGIQDTLNPVPVFNGNTYPGVELGEPLTLSEIETIDGYLETLSVGSGNYVAINYSMSSGGTVTASAPQKVSGCPSGYTAVPSYESSTAVPLSSTSNGTVCVDESDAVPVLNTAGCLNCHTLFDTQGEPFYHTNATGFHIFPSGAVGPDLSDIYTILNPAGYDSYISIGLGGGWGSSWGFGDNGPALDMTNDGIKVKNSDYFIGVLAFDIANIENNIANDLGAGGNPESYFTNPVLALSATVNEYIGGGGNIGDFGNYGYSNIYTSTNAVQETCLLCHGVDGYDGAINAIEIPDNNNQNYFNYVGNSGEWGFSGMITDGGVEPPIAVMSAIDAGGTAPSLMPGWSNSGTFLNSTIMVGGVNVTLNAIISDTLGGSYSFNGPMADYNEKVSAPNSVTATPGPTTGEINLNWTAANPNNENSSFYSTIASNFIVLESSTSSGPFTPVGNIIIADNPTQSYSYTVVGLTSGTTYYFEVEAINNTIGGPPATSSSVSATAK